MKIGDKVKYNHRGKKQTGVIFAIRKADIDGKPKVISYVIDTGKDVRVDELRDGKGKLIDSTRQPAQIDVEPDQLELA